MAERHAPGRGRMAARRGGFTLLELLTVVLIVAILAGIALPRIGRVIAADRVERAAATVAADLRLAQALAARDRRAAEFRLDGAAGYRVTDAVSGAVLASRSLRSDFGLTAVRADPTVVTLFPGGTASAPLTVTLAAGDRTRTVRMTRAGLVRVP